MQINALYSGFNAMHSAQTNTAAIAQTTAEQSITPQTDPAGVDIQSADLDMAMVKLAEAENQFGFGVKIAETSDEMMGTLLDTLA